jgi:hypothetical protein
MGELILAHGLEHGLSPFAVLFAAIGVMGIGFAWLVRQPSPERRSEDADEAEPEEGRGARLEDSEESAPKAL